MFAFVQLFCSKTNGSNLPPSHLSIHNNSLQFLIGMLRYIQELLLPFIIVKPGDLLCQFIILAIR